MKEKELEKKEKEPFRMKKVMDEEVNAKVKAMQTHIVRELEQLKLKIRNWEQQRIRKRIRIEEERK